MKKCMQRLIQIFLILSLVSSLFVGCTSSQQTENTDDQITVYVSGTSEQMYKIVEVANQWSEENGAIPVKVVEGSGDANSYIQSSDKRPDIYWGLSAADTEKLANTNSVDKVPDGLYSDDDFVSKDLVDAVSFNKVKYGIPVFQDTVALFYNKDKVTEVPKTMEDLIEQAKTVGFTTEIDNKFFNYGFIAANGGYIFKNNDGVFDDNDLGVNNAGAIKGYKFIQDLVRQDKLMIAGTTDMMAEYNFQSGQDAFYIGESGRIRTFNTSGKVNFGVTTIPSLGGQEVKPLKSVNMAVVNSESTKKEKSWKLLKYIIDNSSEYIMGQNPKVPVLKASLDTDTFKNDNNIKALYQQSLHATLMPNTIAGEALNTAIDNTMASLTLGFITPEECGVEIEKNIKEAVKVADPN